MELVNQINKVVYIKLKRKEDGSWEGKTEIDLKKLWYLEVNGRLN